MYIRNFGASLSNSMWYHIPEDWNICVISGICCSAYCRNAGGTCLLRETFRRGVVTRLPFGQPSSNLILSRRDFYHLESTESSFQSHSGCSFLWVPGVHQLWPELTSPPLDAEVKSN
jgi:hypothetical protein